MMALSPTGYPQIPPCFGYMNQYLLASLSGHLGREEQDHLNEIWSSPSRHFSQLSREGCGLLPALAVFAVSSSSLAEAWEVACSKQFRLTKENTVCHNI